MLGALFGFKGRLSRPGFWEVLASIALIDVALLVGRMFVEESGLPGRDGPQSPLAVGVAHWIPWVIGVFTAWSLLAAMVKRCHDRGRTGAWVLLALLPMIGWLWLLVDLFVLAGGRGKNRYGVAPHAPTSDQPQAFNWGAEPAVAPVVSAETHHRHDEVSHAPEPEAPHGHLEEGAQEAAHSDEGHGDAHPADGHAPVTPGSAEGAQGPGHHGLHHHDHHAAAVAQAAHDGGASAASHASAHVTVAHTH